MESYDWTIMSKTKKNSIIRYIVNLSENQNIVDTLFFEYDSLQGFLYQTSNMKRINYFIDSCQIKNVRIQDSEPDYN